MRFDKLPIIELDITDSTNNYAMQLIDADKAQHGLTITARSQTGGKGQRGKAWTDAPGESLLMTLVAMPSLPIGEQFSFNAAVAVAIANVLRKLYGNTPIYIKWPNDIIVNDKKAGGILIENVLRGSRWMYAIIGLGLNVNQAALPPELPFATSLLLATGIDGEIDTIRDNIRASVIAHIDALVPAESNMKLYNEALYKRGQKQLFSDRRGRWLATILGVLANGAIELQHEDGSIASYYHGQVLWEWE